MFEKTAKLIRDADGILIGSGTHWDSWSSHLQSLLEHATPTEGTDLWLGKPVAIIITQHAVGGKAVLSRLQGVLSTFGCLIPPMSGLVYSLVNQESLRANGNGSDDVWCRDDIDTICHNLFTAARGKRTWKAWPVDRKNYRARWIDVPTRARSPRSKIQN